MLGISRPLLIAAALLHASALGAAPADLVIRSARVFTVDADRPWASAIAIAGGHILAVGSDAAVEPWIGPDTRVVDLGGRCVFPGFQDAHVHPLEGASGEEFFGCDSSQLGGSKPERWIERIRACRKQKRPIPWVLGGGHRISDLLGVERQPKEILDAAIPDLPVALMDASSHSLWVNSEALARAGITAGTPDPVGGKIVREPDSGEPTGILLDSAGDELLHAALAATPELQEARYRALLASQRLLAENGITSATNARVYWERGNLEPWLRAEKEGALTSRTVLALWAYPHMDDAAQLARLKQMYRDDRGSLLRLSQVKFYSDGVISNNSAALLEPYDRLIHPHADPLGLNYFTRERLARYIRDLERAGFDVHIHAIGDRAVRESLDAIEAARAARPGLGRERRHQLTHLDLVHPEDVPRFGALGVVANFQFNFEPDDEDDRNDWWSSLIGDRVLRATPILEIQRAGGRVVLSSDWDVGPLSPFVSIETIVSLYAGESELSRAELISLAIRAYTLDAAYAMRQEGETGSIEPGKYADLVVADRNVFEISVEDIGETKVVATLLAGEPVFDPTGLFRTPARKPGPGVR